MYFDKIWYVQRIWTLCLLLLCKSWRAANPTAFILLILFAPAGAVVCFLNPKLRVSVWSLSIHPLAPRSWFFGLLWRVCSLGEPTGETAAVTGSSFTRWESMSDPCAILSFGCMVSATSLCFLCFLVLSSWITNGPNWASYLFLQLLCFLLVWVVITASMQRLLRLWSFL